MNNIPSFSMQTNQRTYNRPNLGVVDVPYISRTPIQDMLYLKEKENPKPKQKKQKKNVPKAILSIIPFIALIIVAMVNFFKKK